MKQFNLEEYLKDPNKKVVTRDERSVRILCTDRKGTEYLVVALCTTSNGSEDCYFYFPNGRMYLSADSCMDLFFAPEKKEGWLNLYKNEDGRVAIGTVFPIESEESAKKIASADKDYVATCKITWEE